MVAPAKVLLSQDGTQACARLGMVDGNGPHVYLIDGTTKYLKFDPMSYVMADIEASERRAREQLAAACEQGERAIELYERSVNLADELLACGKFPRGTKMKYQERAWRLRKELKEMLKHGER